MTPPPNPAHPSPLGKRDARSGLNWASDGPIKAHLARTMSSEPKRADREPTASGNAGDSRGPPRARWSGRLVGDPLLHVLHGGWVSRVLDFALVRERGSNRRDSGLAVTGGGNARVGAGVLAGR